MRALFRTVLTQNRLAVLLAYNVAGCLIIFGLLELWRPCYFLTDDNLCDGFPFLTEMGRHLRNGEFPFISDYLFGGHYDWSRDVGCLSWHPFYLIPVLLADTWAKYWIMEAIALPYLLMTTIGFTFLAYQLRNEFKLTICDGWLILYTLSFVFSMYTMMVGASWLCFLGNQSALPWLTIGIMDRKLTRGVFIVILVTIHQFVSSYAGMTLSTTLLLTFFAAGLSLCRHSGRSFFIWCTGNILAYLILSPFLLNILDGFAHAIRVRGFTLEVSSVFSVPATVFPFSFFLGNWTEPLIKILGDPTLSSLTFPFISTLLPCAAAWCLLPALFGPAKWRPLEILCLAMAVLIMLLIIRPEILARAILYVPIIKSMRWPFREIMQFSFFIHLLLILRPPLADVKARRLFVGYSLAMFFLPLPFIRPPSFNALALDRKATLSGDGERFWNQVKPLLKPTDAIITVIDAKVWKANWPSIPYSYLGTANYPALYRVRCLSGYSPTQPLDQVALKTRPNYWFGAFEPSQVQAVLNEQPHAQLIVLEGVHPLKIILRSEGSPDVDLSPYLPPQ